MAICFFSFSKVRTNNSGFTISKSETENKNVGQKILASRAKGEGEGRIFGGEAGLVQTDTLLCRYRQTHNPGHDYK